MQQSAFYAELAEIIDTDVSNLNPDANLEALGWSSLGSLCTSLNAAPRLDKMSTRG
jgi:acyl carrier protein